MNIHYLTQMANAIGEFFQTMPDAEQAEREIAQHLRRFWDPRMRRQLLEHVDSQAGEGLHPIVQQAMLRHRQALFGVVESPTAQSAKS